MRFRKIHIIGAPGSGKSYIAQKLSNIAGYYHCNLDDLFWDNSSDTFGIKADSDIRDKRLKEITEMDLWVIEGVYYGWIDESLKEAEQIIILNTNSKTRDIRILKRFILRKLGLVECKKKETFKGLFDLIKWNHSYDKNITEILKTTEIYSSKRIIICDKSEVNRYIERFKEDTLL